VVVVMMMTAAHPYLEAHAAGNADLNANTSHWGNANTSHWGNANTSHWDTNTDTDPDT